MKNKYLLITFVNTLFWTPSIHSDLAVLGVITADTRVVNRNTNISQKQ